MFHRLRTTSIALCTVALALLSHAASAQTPLGTPFTYQGQLNVSGQPFNGEADVQFQLFNAPTGGAQVGSMIQLLRVPVANGLVTASLDFGLLRQDARWLEIAVRAPAGQGTYATLAGRQAITAAPVAGFALKPWQFTGSATWLDSSSFGNVGVGTSTPHTGFRMQVTGGSGPWYGGIAATGPTSSVVLGEANGRATIGGHNAALNAWERLLINPGGGNVGVGNAVNNPGAALHVASTGYQTLLAGGNAAAGTWFGIQNLSTGGRTWNLISTGQGNGEGAGKLLVGPTTSFGTLDRSVMTMTAGGAVGIGTTSPAATLDVNGTTRTGVIVITGGSDVAEPYDIAAASGTAPAPGMVVSIDPARVGKMKLASTAYDRTVAGIISGANGIKPGITLTQTGTVADGDMPVASIGRVWCLCDADAAGPIETGDMLTTSDTPGHAMKAADHGRSQGAVLGKAMSSLKSGRGMVLVLVTLQ